jgi:hypothetical protein
MFEIQAEFAWTIGRSSDLQAEELPTSRGFPALEKASALGAAFVPAYRCGAVPDSNRIPYLRRLNRIQSYRQYFENTKKARPGGKCRTDGSGKIT